MKGRARAALLALLILGASLSGVDAAVALEPGIPVAVAPGVPDQGRAWELVTPAEPTAALMYGVRGLSVDGGHLSYTTLGPLPGSPSGAPIPAVNFAVRGPGGWANQPVSAPYSLLGAPESYYSGPLYPGPLALSPDLSSSIWTNYLPLRSGESENEAGLFQRAPDGTFDLLAELGREGFFIGASEDTEHVFFMTEKHLLAGDADRIEGKSIYEVNGGTLRLVDVGRDGTLLSDCGSSVLFSSDAGAAYSGAINGTISNDGQRVFFTTLPSCTGPARVYLREAGATTAEISASQCDLADCGPTADAYFAGATPSGSSAFLVSEEKLIDEDPNSHADLYRYDVADGKLTLFSSGQDGTEVSAVNYPVLTSADGSRVYFHGTAQAGLGQGRGESLFLADENGLHFVIPDDSSTLLDPWGALSGLSTNGRFSLLSVQKALTEDDTDKRMDIYRFDGQLDAMTLVSVGSEGGKDPLDATITPEFYARSASSHPYRSMSEDGSRIFFSTDERLLAADHNEVTDVYEWADGDLGLISSGAGDRPDIYLGATPDGRTVLFRTSATLLPADRDGGEMDFYAARIEGGFPEAAPPNGCEAQGCRQVARMRAERAFPASARTTKGGIAVRRPTPAERRRFGATGQISLLVEVPRPGRLLARARARMGHRVKTVAASELEVSHPGPVRLRMSLSKEARHRLASGYPLRVNLGLRLSHLRPARTLSFELEGAS